MAKIILKGARALDPSIGLDAMMDLLIENDKISAVEKAGSFNDSDDAEVVDVSGKLLVPGLVDVHVHLREPGFEQKETITTGAAAAVAGGFTSVCCMPNTNPVIDNVQTVNHIVSRGKELNLCRVLPIGTITMGERGEELANFEELRKAGCVAFSDDGRPVENSLIMRRALEEVKRLGLVLALHEQDVPLSINFAMNEGAYSRKLGVGGMPNAAEDIMISRDIEIAALVGGRVHFCHVSTARGVKLIRRAKEDGLPVSAEATPHNFTLIDEDVGEGNAFFKMNPPLRRPEDVDAILQGIADGAIDCIASDHAPHELASKQKSFQDAAFGILGLQTILPLTLKRVAEGKISLTTAITALTANPRKVFGLEAVTLKKGSTADLTIIDPELEFTFTQKLNRSKSVNGPFFGWKFKGTAIKTIVAGRIVFDIKELDLN